MNMHVAPRTLWFLNTLVRIHVSSHDGIDGISVLEHHARRGDSPPLHVHCDEDEIFHVLEGEVRYRVGEAERLACVGDILLAPKGIPHTYLIQSSEARMLTATRGGFETLVRALGRLTRSDARGHGWYGSIKATWRATRETRGLRAPGTEMPSLATEAADLRRGSQASPGQRR